MDKYPADFTKSLYSFHTVQIVPRRHTQGMIFLRSNGFFFVCHTVRLLQGSALPPATWLLSTGPLYHDDPENQRHKQKQNKMPRSPLHLLTLPNYPPSMAPSYSQTFPACDPSPETTLKRRRPPKHSHLPRRERPRLLRRGTPTGNLLLWLTQT